MFDSALSPSSNHHDLLTDWDWGKKFRIHRWSSEIAEINPQTQFHIRLGTKNQNKRRKVQLVITRGKRGNNEFCYEFQPKLDREFKCGGLKVARITEVTIVPSSNGKDIVFEVHFGRYLYCSTPHSPTQLENFLTLKEPGHAFCAGTH